VCVCVCLCARARVWVCAPCNCAPQVIEIAAFTEHLLSECQHQADYRQCPRCVRAGAHIFRNFCAIAATPSPPPLAQMCGTDPHWRIYEAHEGRSLHYCNGRAQQVRARARDAALRDQTCAETEPFLLRASHAQVPAVPRARWAGRRGVAAPPLGGWVPVQPEASVEVTKWQDSAGF
jgi:hypothetical protein